MKNIANGADVCSSCICMAGVVLTCGKDNLLKLVDPRTYMVLKVLRAPNFAMAGAWSAVALSPHEQHVAAGAADGAIHLWEVLASFCHSLLPQSLGLWLGGCTACFPPHNHLCLLPAQPYGDQTGCHAHTLIGRLEEEYMLMIHWQRCCWGSAGHSRCCRRLNRRYPSLQRLLQVHTRAL